MTWEAHQGRGLFGFTPPATKDGGWQPRWQGTEDDPQRAVVDIKEALAESEGLREAFWKWMRWPDAPPYSGGVLTDWPAREADALAFARQEWAVIRAYAKSQEGR